MTETLIAPRPVIRLIVLDGDLCFPHGGISPGGYEDRALESTLIYHYPAGDCDTCPWPMVDSDYATREKLIERLKGALFDERECNSFFPLDAIIELPDGTEFDF